MKARAGNWVVCEVEGNGVSGSPSLEGCFSKLCALVMVSVLWSYSGSETRGFGGGGEMFLSSFKR